MTTERESLKPCPFCGSDEVSPGRGEGGTEGTHFVECERCGITGPWRPGVLAAIAAWNRRAEPVGEPVAFVSPSVFARLKEFGWTDARLVRGAAVNIRGGVPLYLAPPAAPQEQDGRPFVNCYVVEKLEVGVPTVNAAGGEEEKMALCEKCWGDAYLRAMASGRTQYEEYQALLVERRESPCVPAAPEQDMEVAEIVAMLDIPPIYLDEQVARVLHDARARLAALRRPVEQDVEGLVADVARCIPAPGAVCVEGFPHKTTNVLVSVDLLERVLAALRTRSQKEGE